MPPARLWTGPGCARPQLHCEPAATCTGRLAEASGTKPERPRQMLSRQDSPGHPTHFSFRCAQSHPPLPRSRRREDWLHAGRRSVCLSRRRRRRLCLLQGGLAAPAIGARSYRIAHRPPTTRQDEAQPWPRGTVAWRKTGSSLQPVSWPFTQLPALAADWSTHHRLSLVPETN